MKRQGRTMKQRVEARIKCGRLYRNYKNVIFIMDDESYFTLTHSTINNNDSYYSDCVSETPDHVKYYDKAKFEKKLLVWVAMSSKGMSGIKIIPNGKAINQLLKKN